MLSRKSQEDCKMMNEIVATNKHCPTLQIYDARPKVNAKANQAMGAGTENLSDYPFCKLTFCNIENIHVMRGCLSKLRECTIGENAGFKLKTFINPAEDQKWISDLENSQWFFHLSRILQVLFPSFPLISRPPWRSWNSWIRKKPP